MHKVIAALTLPAVADPASGRKEILLRTDTQMRNLCQGLRPLAGLAVWLCLLGVPALAQTPAADSTTVADTTRRESDTLTANEAREYMAGETTDRAEDTTTVAAPDDRAVRTARYPSDSRLNAYRADRDYQYGEDVPPPESLIGKFLDWFFRGLRGFFASPAYQSFWRYVILAAVAALVIYLGIKAEFLGFLVPASRAHSTLDYENIREDIHAIDFASELDSALQQGNYRLAVRLLYLQALKQLTDRKLIDWKADKTNQQYVHEVTNQPFAADFNALTRDFDYVWYGDFPVDRVRFGVLQDRFQALAHQLPALNAAQS